MLVKKCGVVSYRYEEEKGLAVNELINLMKELFLIKQEDYKAVGLSGFKKKSKTSSSKTTQKNPKDVKLSDLMRKSSVH